MVKKDEEYWYFKAVNAVKNNINTKITAINSEKNDGIDLKTFDANAFFFQSFGNQLPNYIPAICFDSKIESQDTNGFVCSEKINLAIQALVSSEMKANSEDIARLILRYRRVLKDIIEDEFRDFRGIKISGLPDGPFQVNNLNYFTATIEVNFEFA